MPILTRRGRLLLLIALTLAASCQTAPIGVRWVPDLRQPTPGPGNEVLPLFQRPFRGNFPLSNHFDHDLPFQFQDTNRYQLTYWGDREYGGVDGHGGHDWRMPVGTPLLAVADGEVRTVGTDPPFYCPPLRRTVSDQQFVEVLHQAPGGVRFSSAVVHVSRIDVNRGERVRAGQPIALSGNTGCSSEPHVHFHVWRFPATNGGRPARVDPYGWVGAHGPDPWANHSAGARSVWLWKEGEAPALR